jgi:hypothetical protein
LSKAVTKIKTETVANPKEVIQGLCALISVMHPNQFDLSRQMDLVRRIIITHGLDFANEAAKPFNVSFRSEGPIASASRYKMAFTNERNISGHLE